MVGEQFIIDFITEFEAKGVDDFINKLDEATKHIRLVESTVNKMSSFDKFKKKIEDTGKNLVNTDGMITDMSGTVLEFDNQLKALGGANDFAEVLKKEAEMLEKTKKEMKDNNKAQKEGSKNARSLRWNLLTLMFAGQSLQNTFGGMTKNMLEFAGLSSFVNAAMALLFAPVSDEVVGALTGMFTAFANLTDENKAALTGFIAFLGIFGAVLAIGSVLIMTFASLAGIITGVGAAAVFLAGAGLATLIANMFGFEVSMSGPIDAIQQFIMNLGGISDTVSFMDQAVSSMDWGGWGSFTNAFDAAGVTTRDENGKIIEDLDKALADYGWDGTGKPWEFLASKGWTFYKDEFVPILGSMNDYLAEASNWTGISYLTGLVGSIGTAFVNNVQSEIVNTKGDLKDLNTVSFSELGTSIADGMYWPLFFVLKTLEAIKSMFELLEGKTPTNEAWGEFFDRFAFGAVAGFGAGLPGGPVVAGGTAIAGGLAMGLGPLIAEWLAGLGSKQTGGNIPFDGLYNLHAGETVVPAGGGSTNSVNVVINANVANNYDVRRMADEIERYWGGKYTR